MEDVAARFCASLEDFIQDEFKAKVSVTLLPSGEATVSSPDLPKIATFNLAKIISYIVLREVCFENTEEPMLQWQTADELDSSSALVGSHRIEARCAPQGHLGSFAAAVCVMKEITGVAYLHDLAVSEPRISGGSPAANLSMRFTPGTLVTIAAFPESVFVTNPRVSPKIKSCIEEACTRANVACSFNKKRPRSESPPPPTPTLDPPPPPSPTPPASPPP